MNRFKGWVVWTCLNVDWTALLLGLIIGLFAGAAMVTVEIVGIMEAFDWASVCSAAIDISAAAEQ